MKSTLRVAIWLGLLVLSGSPVTGLGAPPSAPQTLPDTAKDRAKWRLATLAAAREVLDELDHPKPLQDDDRAVLLETLNAAMRGDVKNHASRSASQRLCAELAMNLQRARLERRFRDVTAHASEQSPIPITWTDVTAHLGAGWSNTMERSLQSFAATELTPLFQDARSRAVGLLRQDLERKLRFPTADELNIALGEVLVRHPGSLRITVDDEKQLQQKIMGLAIPDNQSCFEELTHVLNDQTLRIASEIKKQFDRQLSSLETTATTAIPDDRREAAAIATALINALESDLATQRAKPAASDVSGKAIPLYPILTPIRDSVPVLSAKVETERLCRFLASSPLLTLETDTLSAAIRAEPQLHLTPTISEALFMKSLPPGLRDKALTTYATGANPPGKVNYFITLQATNTVIAEALQNRISGELHTRLPEARQVVSREQFTRSFATLNETVVLSPDAFIALQDSGGATLTSLDEVLKLYSITVRDRQSLLEETVNHALTIANQKAREGFDILSAQMALVRKLEQDRLAKLREDVTARRPFKAIRAEWQSALEAAWASDARSRTTPYKDLLELTVASLDKTVRQLFDSVRETPNTTATPTTPEARPTTETEQGKVKELRQVPARPEDQSQEPPKDVKPPAPQTSPKGGGSEGAANATLSRNRVDRRNEPDGILLLTGGADTPATARLLSQDGTTTCTASFDPGKPSDAADAIFNTMKPQLKDLWTRSVLEWQKEHSGFGILKRRMPPKLKLFIVIESDDVRHRMSLRLRQHIEEAMQEWYKGADKGTPEVELDWKVGLTIEPQPADRP